MMASRFQFVNAEYLEKRIERRMPQNTSRNTNWSVNTWNAWISERNHSRMFGQPRFPTVLELQFTVPQELNEYLCYFVLEVRTKQGQLYPKDTLYNLLCGLARYIKEDLQRPDLNFMNTRCIHFKRFREILNSQMKLATHEGISTLKRQAQPITEEQERVLWEKGIFDCHTALGLSRCVYFYNCKVFGLGAREEHRNLTIDQYEFGIDDAGKYVEFHGRASQNASGGQRQRNVQFKEMKQYDTDKNISVYKIFKNYTERIEDQGPFYRKPLLPRFQGEVQFSDQPVSSKTLGSYIPTMMAEAGFTGHYTSHSGKITLATRLYEHGVDEQLIEERTGLRSNVVRRCYKRTWTEQQNIISSLADVPGRHKDNAGSPKMIDQIPVALPTKRLRVINNHVPVHCIVPDEVDEISVKALDVGESQEDIKFEPHYQKASTFVHKKLDYQQYLGLRLEIPSFGLGFET